MKRNKELLIQELSGGTSTPSHLEKEMYEQLRIMRKQITAIAKILEGCKQ